MSRSRRNVLLRAGVAKNRAALGSEKGYNCDKKDLLMTFYSELKEMKRPVSVHHQ